MRVIDASPWEKRNLGVDVTEINFDISDNIELVSSCLEKENASYVVLKVPSNRVDLLREAQRKNYSFVETLITLESNYSELSVPNFYQRFLKYITLVRPEKDLYETVLTDIRSGNIFDTDRIALDPEFSKQMAGCRYANWIDDEMERGANIMVAYYKDEPVAFEIVKSKDDKNCDAVLGGLLTSESSKGLGFLGIYILYEIMKIKKYEHCITRVSSNNIPILKLHQMFGFKVTDCTYILTKHN